MRITSLSGSGLLSFDSFTLPLAKRLTTIVGPNGAGKSNVARLLTVCLRAIDAADGARGDVDRMLAAFRASKHVWSQQPGLEARVGVVLTDPAEQALVVDFVRAMVIAAATGQRMIPNMAEVDAWATAEITEAVLAPLMQGQIVASHPGTEEGRWQCAYEFTAPDRDGTPCTYQWIVLGTHADTIIVKGQNPAAGGRTIAMQLPQDVSSAGDPGGPAAPPFDFALTDLLPEADQPTASCHFDLTQNPPACHRRFVTATGLSLMNAGGGRRASLATALHAVFRRALVQTSDTRLLPAGGVSWTAAEQTLSAGAEARLPEMLLALKNGDPASRARFQLIQELFWRFTQGRACEVRTPLGQPAASGSGDGSTGAPPSVWVTVDVVPGSAALAPEVPIEFAGAGAWEALVLASVLAEQSASVVLLDEPAVALHHSLQRQVGEHLHDGPAQFIVITHSAELLPLGNVDDIEIIRLDRHNGVTVAHAVDEACRARMSAKLIAKGNERLPFAWRAVLCEGQDDVGAIITLADRMGLHLRRRNIAVIDCGSRDNLPDYIWFCAQLGIEYLAVMDADASKPDAAANAAAVRAARAQHGGGKLVEFPENLETTFHVPKRKPSFVPAAINVLPFINDHPDPASVPAEVTDLAAALRSLVANDQVLPFLTPSVPAPREVPGPASCPVSDEVLSD